MRGRFVVMITASLMLAAGVGCDAFSACSYNPSIFYQVSTPTLSNDSCVVTLAGNRSSLTLEAPPYCSDCNGGTDPDGPDAPNNCSSGKDGGVVVQCWRSGSAITFGAKEAQAQAVFDALGSSHLSVSASCGGTALVDASTNGWSATESCGG